MYKCLAGRLNNHKNKHPDMKILKIIAYSPNGMNLWIRVKEKLAECKKRKINVAGCKFNLRKKYTEEELLDDIVDIHNERYDHKNIK